MILWSAAQLTELKEKVIERLEIQPYVMFRAYYFKGHSMFVSFNSEVLCESDDSIYEDDSTIDEVLKILWENRDQHEDMIYTVRLEYIGLSEVKVRVRCARQITGVDSNGE